MVLIRALALLCCVCATPALAGECANAPSVTEVYPRTNVLPENLLRLYVYFNQPMDRSEPLAGIHLLDKKGNVLNGVFLSNKVDLWSPDSRRLTVLFDPGRVKTGLVAHNKLGRALQAGQRYTVVIGTSLRNRTGCNIKVRHEKQFRAVEADFEAPDPDNWQISSPKSNTHEQLAVKLNGPHDHVSLAYRIRVKDLDGKIVPGHIDLGPKDDEWHFRPNKPWRVETYALVIDPVLEDVAGNRTSGSFERPLSDTVAQPVSKKFRITD